MIEPVASYPEEGFEILQDPAGAFLLQRDSEDLIPIPTLVDLYRQEASVQ